ncbi:MAG: hypothetical protein R3B81_01935 [bacterium]
MNGRCVMLLLAVFLAAPATGAAGGTYEYVGAFDGAVWTSGTLATMGVGDSLSIVGTFVPSSGEWVAVPWDTAGYDYTFWIHGWAAEVVTEDSARRNVVLVGPGRIDLYREPVPAQFDYGVYPPNATCPASFADGELVLRTEATSGLVSLHLASGIFTLSLGDATYVAGLYLSDVLTECGVCAADLDFTGATSQTAPAGFDAPVTGHFFNTSGVGVESESWGRTKASYR